MYKLKSRKVNDTFLVCSDILNRCGVKHTKTHLAGILEEHPEYPSLLCIKDGLERYAVQSAAIRKGGYAYHDFEAPFICSVQQSDWGTPFFTVVTAADEATVVYLDPKTGEETTVSDSEFKKIDKEIMLLVDGEAAQDEVNYAEHRKQERTADLLGQLPFAVAFLAMAFSAIFILRNYPFTVGWPTLFFLLTSGIGLVTSSLLVWHDIDAHNPFLKEVCGGQGKKMNCDAVLGSNGSTFLGISWSLWGFAYFATFFLSQVLFAPQLGFASLWAVLSVLVAPYILYSVYYQWRVLKQWCPLCLSIQAVLLVNLIVSIIMYAKGAAISIDGYAISTVMVLGAALLMLGYYAVPMLKQARDSKNYERKWKRMRYHPDIFKHLLEKSNPITVPYQELGIVIGNPQAKNEIIKVCNPYCGPCSKAHPELERIVQNNPNVKLRIIFTANGKDDDGRTPPVAHLLAIQDMYNIDKVKQAIDDWYLTPQKDYRKFAEKYPVNGELKQQLDKIYAMRDWCEIMKIRATPTIFVDGYELPDSYHIAELKELF